jgi:hypothetical protein
MKTRTVRDQNAARKGKDMLFTSSELNQLNDHQLEALHSQLLSMLMATDRFSDARQMILDALARIENLLGTRVFALRQRHSRGI